MNKIISLCILLNTFLFSDISIGTLKITYKITNNIDYVYIENSNKESIIKQNNLWSNAVIGLRLLSANEKIIQIEMYYIGNKELGYIYTFNKIDNNFKLNNIEMYQLDGNITCKMSKQIVDLDTFKLIETNDCYSTKKISIDLNELFYILKNYKTKNIISKDNIVLLLYKFPLENKTLQKYNDIAYYLQQANANEEAIFLLEKIIEKYPNRIVAYLNLADSYIGINNKEEAKENYEKYVKLMKQNNKDEKIPKRVLEFLENE